MKKSRIIAAIFAIAITFVSVFALASCQKDSKDKEIEKSKTTKAVSENETVKLPSTVSTTQPATDVDFVPNVTSPANPAEEVTQGLTRVNEYATNPDTGKLVTEVGEIEFVYPEYFAQGNSYVAIRDILIDDTGFTHNADAYVDFEVLARGDGEEEKTVKVSYIGYDANGEITRRSQITVNLFGTNVGDIIEDCRMDFKRETVKIVFTEFKEITE